MLIRISLYAIYQTICRTLRWPDSIVSHKITAEWTLSAFAYTIPSIDRWIFYILARPQNNVTIGSAVVRYYSLGGNLDLTPWRLFCGQPPATTRSSCTDHGLRLLVYKEQLNGNMSTKSKALLPATDETQKSFPMPFNIYRRQPSQEDWTISIGHARPTASSLSNIFIKCPGGDSQSASVHRTRWRSIRAESRDENIGCVSEEPRLLMLLLMNLQYLKLYLSPWVSAEIF